MTDGEVVLLLKRKPPAPHANTWAIPGGKLEEGESPLGAAKRETEEESGHLPTKMTRFGDVADHVFKTFMMEIEKPYNVKLSDESSDYQWVPLSRVSGMDLHPGMKDKWPEIAKTLKNHFG